MDFKTRFKMLRSDSKMSAEKVGEILGVSKVAISHWENGTHQPSNQTLVNISVLFNCSIDYLLGNSDIRNKADDASFKYACSDYDKLNSDNKNIIDELASRLLKSQEK